MTDPVAPKTVLPHVEGVFPHYLSTYCIHGLHADCRLTCKHCQAACLCGCHLVGDE